MKILTRLVLKVKKIPLLLFLKNYHTSEVAVSHIVLYCQQLSIAQYQVSFYANNYFE